MMHNLASELRFVGDSNSVEPAAGSPIDESALIAHVKGHLAAYKAPKRVVSIDTIGRAPNGKVDYKRMKAYAADELGIPLD